MSDRQSREHRVHSAPGCQFEPELSCDAGPFCQARHRCVGLQTGWQPACKPRLRDLEGVRTYETNRCFLRNTRRPDAAYCRTCSGKSPCARLNGACTECSTSTCNLQPE